MQKRSTQTTMWNKVSSKLRVWKLNVALVIVLAGIAVPLQATTPQILALSSYARNVVIHSGVCNPGPNC